MYAIYKYPLEGVDKQIVEMPDGAEILCVQTQNNKPCLWAKVNLEEKNKANRIIRVIGTGHLQDQIQGFYIGTVQQMGGALVWHVFEE